MEQYLVILFVLFSVVSALLERRKRARQLEEAKRTREERLERDSQQGGPPPVAAEEEVEEEEVWPFPMAGDPFESRRPQRPSAPAPEPEAEAEVAGGPPGRGRSLMEVLEDQMREAEERARRQEEGRLRQERAQAEATARQPREPQPRQRLQDLVHKRQSEERPRRHRRKGCHWGLTPRSARRAIVLAEILGRPKALRQGEVYDRL